MKKILPYNKWTKEDKKKLRNLKKLRITPIEAYHISWALFDRFIEFRKYLEEFECKKCWMKNHHGEDFYEKREELLRNMKEFKKINSFFHPYHNLLGENYEFYKVKK